MRSLLFVPGDSERKLAKSLGVGADALIFDLEDSIGPDRKSIARTMVAEFLRAPDVRAAPVVFWVRINAFDTAHWEDDLTTVMAAAPDGIMLPKSTSGDDVASLSVALGKLETRFGLKHGQTQILPIATEVPISLLRMETYVGISPRMTVFSWGCEDLSAELGAMSSRDPAGRLTSPFRLARDLCLMTAVASGAQPVDTVFVNFRDNSGLETECDEAVRDGFTGKVAIHPSQVPIINAAFTPDEDQIAWAHHVTAVFQDTTTGVASLHGEMLDRPHLKRAQTILARADAAARGADTLSP